MPLSYPPVKHNGCRLFPKDYWLSLVHKKLVGQLVLYVEKSLERNRTIRVYAHCTDTKSGWGDSHLHLRAFANVLLCSEWSSSTIPRALARQCFATLNNEYDKRYNEYSLDFTPLTRREQHYPTRMKRFFGVQYCKEAHATACSTIRYKWYINRKWLLRLCTPNSWWASQEYHVQEL